MSDLFQGMHLLNKHFLSNCFASQARQTLCLLAASKQEVISGGRGDSDLNDGGSMMNQRCLFYHSLEMIPLNGLTLCLCPIYAKQHPR